jgi:type I restriction enzyme S subunit
MELINGYKKSTLGVIPIDWNDKTLGDIGESLIGLTYRPSEVRKYGTLVLRSSNVQNGTLCFDDNVFVEADIPERIMVRPGDILICVRNGSRDLIGKAALIDERAIGMTFGAFMGVFRSNHGHFLLHVFQSGIFKKQINEHLGATINQITNKSLNSFKVPLPPTDEEKRKIAKALSDVDALLAALDQLIAKKRNLKQAAMQQLLTGQIRLPGFDGEWDVKRLGEIFTIFAGKSKSAFVLEEGDFWVCDMGSVSIDGQLIVSKRTNFKGDFLKHGDLIMPKDDIGGGNIIGKVGYINANETFVLGDHVYCLRALKDNSRFLAYAINSHLVNSLLRKKVIGSAQLGLGRKSVTEQEIFLPSIAEQTAIAEVLTEIDAEIFALEERREKTVDLKQGMMQELLTGRTRLI